MQFQNPPQFLNVGKPDTRDAMYKTEALLDFYFHHPNVAPFLATRIIKCFGISNPSRRYVRAVADALNLKNIILLPHGPFWNGKTNRHISFEYKYATPAPEDTNGKCTPHIFLLQF